MVSAYGPKRTRSQLERDRARISFLYLRGTPLHKVHEIINEEAEGYSLTYQTIWNDLKNCRMEWQKDAKRSIELWVSEQLKKIDVLEMEYWNAWLRSQKEKTSSTVKSRGALKQKKKKKKGDPEDGGDLVATALEKWEKKEQLIGDPRFLDGFFNCIIARLKILGRETPDSDDRTKEAAERIRDTIKDIDSLMDLGSEEDEKPEPAGAGKSEK